MEQYNAELAALAQIEQLYRQQMEQQVAQQRAYYAQLAQQLAPIAGQVEGIVNRQTEATTGFARGFSDAMAQIANQSTGAAQADVAGFGMPTGNLTPVGEAAGNALYGEKGYVPATGFSSYGAAQAGAAAMLPGTARLQGEQQIGRMQSDFASQFLLPLQAERLKLASELPQRRAEARETKRQDALDLFNLGFLSQRELARRLGVRGWKRYPDRLKGEGEMEFDIREVGPNLVAVDPRTLKTQVIYEGPRQLNVRFFQTADGADWTLNLDTGDLTQVGGPAVRPPIIRGGPTTGYDLLDPVTGAPLGHIPATAPRTGAGAGPTWKQAGFRSAADMAATARRLAREAFQGTEQVSSDLLTGEPRSVRTGKLGAEEAYDKLVSSNIPPLVAWRALRKYYPKLPRPKGSVTASGGAAKGDKANWLASLWVQAGGDPAVANIAAAIALAESGGRIDALNPNAPDYSVGLWQINYHGGLRKPRTRQFGPPELLMRDPLANARAAVAIYRSAGNSFRPWTTYTSGAYRRYG